MLVVVVVSGVLVAVSRFFFSSRLLWAPLRFLPLPLEVVVVVVVLALRLH